MIFVRRQKEKAMDNKTCLVKKFAHNHKHDYPLKDFGSMGGH